MGGLGGSPPRIWRNFENQHWIRANLGAFRAKCPNEISNCPKNGGAIAPPAPPSRTPMSINFADSDFSLSFMSFVDVDVIIAHLYRMFPNRRGRSKLQGSGGPEPRVEWERDVLADAWFRFDRNRCLIHVSFWLSSIKGLMITYFNYKKTVFVLAFEIVFALLIGFLLM